MLHTREEFRKRGLGSYLVKKIAEKTITKGMIPYVHIEDGNEKSISMFSKLGFVQSIKAVWVEHYPA